jgi:VCBS repeat-containing protein
MEDIGNMMNVRHFLIKLLYTAIISTFILGVLSGFGAYNPAAASTLSIAGREVALEELGFSEALHGIANISTSNLLAAGDENWDEFFGVPGMNGSVYALVIDSNGYLYAGGSFTTAGGVSANYVARWDGVSWTDLDGGVDDTVLSLAVDSAGNLYAGGDFTTAADINVNRIARWDGASWHPLGSGMNNPVSALAVDENDQLYAGGAFTDASGVSVNRIARWDGSQWNPLGSGMNAPVRSLSTDVSGSVFAGGVFTTAGDVSANRIARWDGSQWHALGTGLNNIAWAMEFDEAGSLYVGGGFTQAGGMPANHIARWDGTNWYAVGGGVDNIVRALTLDGDGRLSVGGDFTTAGGLPFNYIARLDGASWLPLGSGMNAPVYALAPNVLGDLYVGGDFSSAGDKVANYIAWWHRSYYPPVANDDSYTTSEDVALIEAAPGVLGNDTDADDNRLMATLQSGPDDGSLTLNLDGSFVYTPTLNFNGVDSFLYIASDGLYTDTASVTITVTSVNDPPIAVSDAYSTAEDTELSVPAPGVLSNDLDVDGDPLTASVNQPPSHGALAFSLDGSFSYMPDVNYFGQDSFMYDVSDGVLTSTASVSLTVTAVNDPPVALDDSASTDQNTPITTGDVLVNDSDVDGDTLVVDSFDTNGTQGLVAYNGNGTFNYDPNGAYDGLGDGEQAEDTFTYTAADGNGGYDTAIVTITVSGVNDAPLAFDDSYDTDEDTTLVVPAPGVLDNDSDPDDDPLTALLIDDTLHGTLNFNADGSFTFSPDENYFGPDNFSYEISDGFYTSTATVYLTINSVNDPPTALGDSASTDQDTPVTTGDVLANDSDVEGDELYVDSYDDSQTSGQVTYNGDGTFDYDPNGQFDWLPEGEQADDTFTYTAADGNGGFDTATVTITVSGLNDAPIALDDIYTTDEDVPLVVNAPGVLLNDSDVDGDPLSTILMNTPRYGTVVLHVNGSFTYTPDPNYYGEDWFTYHASDGFLESHPAFVYITVNPVNDAPLVEAGLDQEVDEGQLVSFSGSFIDPGLLNGSIHVEEILWEFGDGLSATATLTPSHIYADDGIYTATLTITDDQGSTGSDWLLVVVNNVGPSLDTLEDRIIVAGHAAYFTISFSDPGIVDTHSIVITWGDDEDETHDLTLGMREFEANHRYSAPGTYTASITVMDDDGDQDTHLFNVTVIPSTYIIHLPVISRQP